MIRQPSIRLNAEEALRDPSVSSREEALAKAVLGASNMASTPCELKARPTSIGELYAIALVILVSAGVGYAKDVYVVSWLPSWFPVFAITIALLYAVFVVLLHLGNRKPHVRVPDAMRGPV